jgi:hypothetical protein
MRKWRPGWIYFKFSVCLCPNLLPMNFLKPLLSVAILLTCVKIKSQTLSFTVTNLSPSYSITCANPTVNLTAASNYIGGPVSYTWSNGTNVYTGANVSITNAGNYTVIAYVSSSTNTFQVIPIGINVTPPVTALSPTFQNITCSPSSITNHTASSNISANHLWLSPQGGTVFMNSATFAIYTPGGPGTYTHIAINPVNGCPTAKNFTVTSASGFPSFSLTSSPANFTLGCSNILTVNIVNAQTNPTAGGAVSYTLLPPGSTIGFPGPISNYTINTPGTWTAVVRDNATFCDTRSAFTVIQNTTAPAISLSASSSTVCSGDPVLINASGADTYTFTGGISNGTGFNPSVTTTYSVTGTNTVSGCSSTNPSTITISVYPTPTVTINASSTSVCFGNTVSLSGTGADIYFWSGGITNGQSFSVTASTTYSVIGSSTLTGCTGAASQLIGVNPIPTVTSSASSPTACSGGTVILSGGGAATYTWSGGVINNVPFSPSITTTYTVTGADMNGCTDTDVITITVTPSPPLSITASDPIFCAGMTTTLTASGANTYTWIGGGNNANQTVSPLGATIYTVTGTAANNCTTSGTYTLDINTSTAFNYTVNGMVVSLHISGTGCSSFFWDFGNNTTSTINPDPVVTYTTAGIYGVCLKCVGLPNACVKCFNLTVPGNASGGVGIQEMSLASGIRIYPNPNNGEFMLNIDNGSENTRFELYNSLGQIVYVKALISTENHLTPNVPGGIYYYCIINENAQPVTGKLIIE